MLRSFGSSSFTTLPAIEMRAFGDAFEPGDHPQQRRLAATRRADHHDELAVGHVHVDAVQHELFAVVGFLNALQSQCSHAVLAFSLLAA